MDRQGNTRLAQTRYGGRKAAQKFFAGTALAAVLTGSAHAGALTAKGDLLLAHAKLAAGQSSVIVTFAGQLTSAQQAQIHSLGATVIRELPFIHAAALRVPSRNLNKLAAFAFVRHLSYDSLTHKCDEFTVDSSLDNAAFQQYGLTGKGVTVAIVDSGIAPQIRDLEMPASAESSSDTTGAQTRLIDGVNFVPDAQGNVDPAAYDDFCGHGTHVAGIVAGDGASSTGSQYTQTFYGVAPLSNVVAVRVLDQNGAGTVDTVLAGIQWVLDNRAKDNIRVMNLSLGHPMTEPSASDPLCQAVEAAWKAGIVVVCAAGNAGRLSATNSPGASNEGWGTAYGSIESPGDDPYVITVGAMKQMDSSRANDTIATYSSRGPTMIDHTLKPDIVAPGNQVISDEAPNSTLVSEFGSDVQVPLSQYENADGAQQGQMSSDYIRLCGTSMATPVVAAAAALMLQANPSLSPDTIKARLMNSADKWSFPDGSGDPCTYGAGYLDIPAALASKVTVSAGTYARSPRLVINAQGNVFIAKDSVTVITDTLLGLSSLWGTGVTDPATIWGANAFNPTLGVSDSRAIWGRSTLSNSQSLSSNRALWGNTSTTDSRAIWGRSSTSDSSTMLVK